MTPFPPAPLPADRAVDLLSACIRRASELETAAAALAARARLDRSYLEALAATLAVPTVTPGLACVHFQASGKHG